MPDRTCPLCGIPFTPKTRNHTYCSTSGATASRETARTDQQRDGGGEATRPTRPS